MFEQIWIWLNQNIDFGFSLVAFIVSIVSACYARKAFEENKENNKIAVTNDLIQEFDQLQDST